jgi:hypothetical protein
MADTPTRIYIGKAATPVSPQAPFQGAPSFVSRLIEITVSLTPNQQTGQPNTFAGTNSDTVTFSGFRTMVRIENAGGVTAHAGVDIFGLSPSFMNQLSTLGMIFDMVQKNTITISAGDSNGVSPVFSGTIAQAFANYNSLPSASMHFECQVGLINGVVPVAASSFPQTTSVATIMAGFANQLQPPVGFENNGVTATLPSCYFPGSIRDQIREVAEHAHINAEILPGSGGQQVLAIWPMGGSRTSLAGGNIPLVSKDTGMILTPSFGPNGFAIVRTLFNPQIAFGGSIQVQSGVVPQLNRQWVVMRMGLALDAFVPKGKWEQSLVCYRKGFVAPPPP